MLLTAVASPEEEDLLRRWLADDDEGWVRPSETRGALARKEAGARRRMKEEGVKPHEVSVAKVGPEIYDLLSRAAHHRRSGFPESSQVDQRLFAYGPHPAAAVRARNVDYAGQLIETALVVVIDSLDDIVGGGHVDGALAPMMERLARVRERFPLTR